MFWDSSMVTSIINIATSDVNKKSCTCLATGTAPLVYNIYFLLRHYILIWKDKGKQIHSHILLIVRKQFNKTFQTSLREKYEKFIGAKWYFWGEKVFNTPGGALT